MFFFFLKLIAAFSHKYIYIYSCNKQSNPALSWDWVKTVKKLDPITKIKLHFTTKKNISKSKRDLLKSQTNSQFLQQYSYCARLCIAFIFIHHFFFPPITIKQKKKLQQKLYTFLLQQILFLILKFHYLLSVVKECTQVLKNHIIFT